MTSLISEKYSAKQLSPFTGNIQIIKLPFARALSIDGKTWQIQTICESHQQQWNINTTNDMHRRYIIYGTWSEQNSLSRYPIDPTLDVPSENSIREHLMPEISNNLNKLPFAAKDAYEYWLLDSNNYLPIALLATSIDKELIFDIQASKRWRSRSGSESKFATCSTIYQSNPFLLLESYINNLSCKPLCCQWFYRENDRSGTAMHGHNLSEQLFDRVLPANDFPELLLTTQSEFSDTKILIKDYLHHLAPRLLTLHHISKENRHILETAAQTQPEEVLRYHKLYPVIINQTLINKILVEAKLRSSIK